jgi:DNA recombination protein RmuC
MDPAAPWMTAEFWIAHAPAIGIGLAVGLAVAALAIVLRRPKKPPTDPVAELRMVELTARVHQMGELLGRAQAQLQDAVNARLDSVSHNLQTSLDTRLGAVSQNLQTTLDTTKKDTTDNLRRLAERLAVIDSAQKNITELASQVTSLQKVLDNKQRRGAFGQGRMEAIVQDGLPKGSFEFQATLGNGKRPDCVVYLPDQRPLVIDAKFPLEAFTAFRDAQTDDERKAAGQRLRQDVGRHIADIADKYLIAGETQDTALMFVPSESIYAELHDGFEDLVQKAYRARVVVVSPSLLMLAIQVVQQIQRDARMREAADKIHAEVGTLMDDIGRLAERVRKLQTHSNQAGEDIRQILISTEKIERRGERIRQVEFDDADTEDGKGTESGRASNVIKAPLRLQVSE